MQLWENNKYESHGSGKKHQKVSFFFLLNVLGQRKLWENKVTLLSVFTIEKIEFGNKFGKIKSKSQYR